MTNTSSWFVVIATTLVLLFMTSCVAMTVDDVTGWKEQKSDSGLQRGRRSVPEKRLPRYGRSPREDFDVQVGLPEEILSRVRSLVYSRLANREAIKRIIENDVMKYIQKERQSLERDTRGGSTVKEEVIDSDDKWYKRASSAPEHENNNIKFFEEQRRMGPEFNPTGW